MTRAGAFGWILSGFALVGASAFAAPVPAPEPPAPVPGPAGDAAPAGDLPHIVFDKTELDLGDIVHGKDAVAAFTYHNTGKVPLHILSAKPG